MALLLPWRSSLPLSCDFADQPRDDVAFGLFGFLQLFELLDGHASMSAFSHSPMGRARLEKRQSEHTLPG